jgi:uncharacterized protein YeaO (DUF488 family)
MITLSWAYEKDPVIKGTRILVDRLWPRGIKKEKLNISRWLKDIAPSDELRKWFAHDPLKWQEFKTRYFSELEANPKTKEFLELCNKGDLVLVYSSREKVYNNAVALKEYAFLHE